MEKEFANLDVIEAVVAPHRPELVKLCFRIVRPSFPILHKKAFLEKRSRTYRESAPIGLGAVYLMALNWWSYSYSLSALPKPNTKELERLLLKSYVARLAEYRWTLRISSTGADFMGYAVGVLDAAAQLLE